MAKSTREVKDQIEETLDGVTRATEKTEPANIPTDYLKQRIACRYCYERGVDDGFIKGIAFMACVYAGALLVSSILNHGAE